MLSALKERARVLKAEVAALYFALRHPGTPWYARLFAAGIVAHALSPIDLIPDFIPVLGYLDELILLPIGIYLALKMIPPDVMAECRTRANRALLDTGRGGRVAAAIIIVIWVALAVFGVVWFYRALRR